MKFTKDENGNAAGDFHGVTVVAAVNCIDFGSSTKKALTDADAGKVVVSTGLIFPDGSTEDGFYKFALDKMNFPNVALYSDNTRTEWNPELKEWFVDKLVNLTNPTTPVPEE